MSQYNNKPGFKFTFRAAMHLIPGIAFIILAFFLVKVQKFGTIDLGTTGSIAFAALLVVYGVFRIWRGVKEGQMTDEE